jgi:hypothetical protein
VKKIISHILWMIALTAVMGAVGCATVSTRTQPYLGVAGCPPTDPARVQILTSEPNRQKERLGEIFLSVEGSPTREKLEKKLRNAAAKLGADAVFVVSDQTRFFPVVYVDWWSSTVSQEAVRGIVAVAIKYK